MVNATASFCIFLPPPISSSLLLPLHPPTNSNILARQRARRTRAPRGTFAYPPAYYNPSVHHRVHYDEHSPPSSPLLRIVHLVIREYGRGSLLAPHAALLTPDQGDLPGGCLRMGCWESTRR
eukprot:3116855-Pyramimonas_sp.AAC.1